ncbi:type II toxin-antitoxin system RelE/ParE family toxin [Rheinheimera soli]|uniref:Toxin ParE1/3/4 n=1 Tax=Rheinheimera soli TaxID=443616 RepID=A0ABU1VYS1_9GAMM|nr:type II toxin-antitoxin system RelE/ParE family toxin [Rheinheimera soli]MDR7120842.1 toxin ParE1/3/4 [Rheinheimera soli]
MCQLSTIFIAVENPAAAKHLVQSVFAKVECLEMLPDSGRIPAELEHLNYREVLANPYLIFYKHLGEKVFVLYVMCEERDLRKFMLNSKND